MSVVIRDIPPQPTPFEQIEGTIWGELAQLSPGRTEKEKGPRRTSYVPIVPQEGHQTVGAGDTAEFSLSGTFRATAIQLAIPDNMEADLEVDGRTKLSVDDGNGFEGTIPLATGERDYSQIRQGVELSVTNNGSGAVDVQASLVVSV